MEIKTLRYFRPILSLNYSGTISSCYIVAGAEILPPNSLSDRNKRSSMVTIFLVSLTCVVTSDHK
jgi:hypothetical protein